MAKVTWVALKEQRAADPEAAVGGVASMPPGPVTEEPVELRMRPFLASLTARRQRRLIWDQAAGVRAALSLGVVAEEPSD